MRIRKLVSTSFIVMALVGLVSAQSPSLRNADPGPMAPASGLSAAAGYIVTNLFNVGASVPSAIDMVRGPGGDLYFTSTAGTICGGLPTTNIYRVFMSGASPRQPFAVTQYTTAPIDGHLMAFDAATNTLFACGTCNQTQFIYRIGTNGIPAAINPLNPINDPDGLALGLLPGSSDLKLFVAAQDALYVFGNLTATVPSITQIPVNLAAIGLPSLGNWSYLRFDPFKGTLLGGYVGSPSVFRTIEITFTAGQTITATASLLSNFRSVPAEFDGNSARYFEVNNALGYINQAGASAAFVPFVSGFAGSPVMTPAGVNGSYFVLDTGNGNVYRLDPPLRSNRLEISASTGGVANFTLHAPAPHGNEAYLIFASIHGATPGTIYNNFLIPLNYDELTDLAMNLAIAQHPAIPGWNAFLDQNGNGSASIILGPNVAFPNLTLHMVFALGQPSFISNAIWIQFTN